MCWTKGLAKQKKEVQKNSLVNSPEEFIWLFRKSFGLMVMEKSMKIMLM